MDKTFINLYHWSHWPRNTIKLFAGRTFNKSIICCFFLLKSFHHGSWSIKKQIQIKIRIKFYNSLNELSINHCLFSKDQRKFLVLWIIVMVLHVSLEIAHFIYLIVIDTVSKYFWYFYNIETMLLDTFHFYYYSYNSNQSQP